MTLLKVVFVGSARQTDETTTWLCAYDVLIFFTSRLNTKGCITSMSSWDDDVNMASTGISEIDASTLTSCKAGLRARICRVEF